MHTLLYHFKHKKKPQFEFSAEKNKLLIKQRGISFEEIILAIEEDAILDIFPHSNVDRYPNQYLYIVNLKEYVYIVPFVIKDENTHFLKTIFPHRKLTKFYLKGKNYEET